MLTTCICTHAHAHPQTHTHSYTKKLAIAGLPPDSAPVQLCPGQISSQTAELRRRSGVKVPTQNKYARNGDRVWMKTGAALESDNWYRSRLLHIDFAEYCFIHLMIQFKFCQKMSLFWFHTKRMLHPKRAWILPGTLDPTYCDNTATDACFLQCKKPKVTRSLFLGIRLNFFEVSDWFFFLNKILFLYFCVLNFKLYLPL